MAIQSRDPPNAVPILLTRPLPQSERFAAQLAQRFRHRAAPVITPLLAPRFLPGAVPGGARALILTSETGAEAVARLRADGVPLPQRAYCVGDRTAAAATQAGLTAISADGDAAALIALILSRGETGPLLHLRGQDTRGDIAARLTAAGVETGAAIVYAQVPQPLTDPARQVLAGTRPVIVPLFSPRTAALFAGAAQGTVAPLHLVTISPAAASAVAGLTAARLVIAAHPDAEAMLDAIGDILRDIPAA